MRLLELFSGTGSFSKAAQELGWETISLDVEKKYKPTLLCRIEDFDETAYPRDAFTHVHASTVCTEYSRALTTRPRDLEAGDKLAQISLRILLYFAEGGASCSLENPHSGLMKERPFMEPYRDNMHVVDYCRYNEGFLGYRKRTCFWTWNLPTWQPRPLCRYDCQASVGRRHVASAQRGGRRTADGTRDKNTYSQSQLYSIPSELCREILLAAAENVGHLLCADCVPLESLSGS